MLNDLTVIFCNAFNLHTEVIKKFDQNYKIIKTKYSIKYGRLTKKVVFKDDL